VEINQKAGKNHPRRKGFPGREGIKIVTYAGTWGDVTWGGLGGKGFIKSSGFGGEKGLVTAIPCFRGARKRREELKEGSGFTWGQG